MMLTLKQQVVNVLDTWDRRSDRSETIAACILCAVYDEIEQIPTSVSLYENAAMAQVATALKKQILNVISSDD